MRLKQMHKQLFILFFVCLLPSLAIADPLAEALFKKGNLAYEKAKYEEAVKDYNQLLDQGYGSAEVYFNLGNSHYRLGEMPSAVLNYEKALKVSPGDEDIKVNLQLANSKLKDKFEILPEFFLSKWWNSLLLFYSRDTWSGIGVAGVLLGSMLLVVYLFSLAKSIKKSAFYVGLVAVLIGFFSLMMSSLQEGYFEAHQEAIVFNGMVSVKAGPSAGEQTLVMIHEGTKVTIRAKKNNWANVILPNGNEGWMSIAELKEI